MKAIIFVSAALLNLISIISLSQSSITLQPEKDAMTREFAGTGDNKSSDDSPKYIKLSGLCY